MRGVRRTRRTLKDAGRVARAHTARPHTVSRRAELAWRACHGVPWRVSWRVVRCVIWCVCHGMSFMRVVWGVPHLRGEARVEVLRDGAEREERLDDEAEVLAVEEIDRLEDLQRSEGKGREEKGREGNGITHTHTHTHTKRAHTHEYKHEPHTTNHAHDITRAHARNAHIRTQHIARRTRDTRETRARTHASTHTRTHDSRRARTRSHTH